MRDRGDPLIQSIKKENAWRFPFGAKVCLVFLGATVIYLFTNIQANDSDQNGRDHQRVADDSRYAEHINVINQPAGVADEIQNTNDTRAVDSQGYGGYDLGQYNENTDGAVP